MGAGKKSEQTHGKEDEPSKAIEMIGDHFFSLFVFIVWRSSLGRPPAKSEARVMPMDKAQAASIRIRRGPTVFSG
jgi:hypothetical protein